MIGFLTSPVRNPVHTMPLDATDAAAAYARTINGRTFEQRHNAARTRSSFWINGERVTAARWLAAHEVAEGIEAWQAAQGAA